jgi:hypothetical protein
VELHLTLAVAGDDHDVLHLDQVLCLKTCQRGAHFECVGFILESEYD